MMSSGCLSPEFTRFLVEVKRNTYAGQDDDATLANPLLADSKQLEWRDGNWLYRDIYYGMSFFSGLEVVYCSGEPVWSMTYSGGAVPDIRLDETRAVYAFLRSALREVPVGFPVRGPVRFSRSDYYYHLEVTGGLASFCGREEIVRNTAALYSLTFAGGILR
jgi:hypothetical protein